MDQSTLVRDQIGDGRRFVERFAADGNPIRAAFWVKTDEDGLWFLYIATDLVDQSGPAAAYQAVNASLDKLSEPGIASSEIKVISPNNPIAKDVLAAMNRNPRRKTTRFGGTTLGRMIVEQAYIYPAHFFTFTQPNPMTTEDISREILRFMNRGPGLVQSSRVTLKDGASFNGVPFSIQFGSQKALVVQFIVDGETAPRVVGLDEIASVV